MSLRNADRTTDSGLGNRALDIWQHSFDNAPEKLGIQTCIAADIRNLPSDAATTHSQPLRTYTINTCKPILPIASPNATCTRGILSRNISRILHDITWAISCCAFPFAVGTRARKPAVSRPICPLKSLGFWVCACSVQSQLCSHAHECIANMCRLMKTDWDWWPDVGWLIFRYSQGFSMDLPSCNVHPSAPNLQEWS